MKAPAAPNDAAVPGAKALHPASSPIRIRAGKGGPTSAHGGVAHGRTGKEKLAAFRDLEEADMPEALRYATEAVRERELPLVRVS